ncbi:MAG: hypothetical protein ACOCP8_03430 [archaeon]
MEKTDIGFKQQITNSTKIKKDDNKDNNFKLNNKPNYVKLHNKLDEDTILVVNINLPSENKQDLTKEEENYLRSKRQTIYYHLKYNHLGVPLNNYWYILEESKENIKKLLENIEKWKGYYKDIECDFTIETLTLNVQKYFHLDNNLPGKNNLFPGKKEDNLLFYYNSVRERIKKPLKKLVVDLTKTKKKYNKIKNNKDELKEEYEKYNDGKITENDFEEYIKEELSFLSNKQKNTLFEELKNSQNRYDFKKALKESIKFSESKSRRIKRRFNRINNITKKLYNEDKNVKLDKIIDKLKTCEDLGWILDYDLEGYNFN